MWDSKDQAMYSSNRTEQKKTLIDVCLIAGRRCTRKRCVKFVNRQLMCLLQIYMVFINQLKQL